MAFAISDRAQSLLDQNTISPIYVLEIEGFEQIFTSQKLDEFWKLDEGYAIDTPGLFVDGTINKENVLPYISIDDGTTQNLSQQIELDKGGAGASSRFRVALIDKDESITNLFSPGVVVSDILGKEANVYLIFKGSTYPQDRVRIFSGKIDSQSPKPGLWSIGIASNEADLDQEILTAVSTELTATLTDVEDTAMEVLSTANMLTPQDALETYVKIEDEIIKYEAIDSGLGEIQTLTRGQFGTAAVQHDPEAEVTTFYRLLGDPIDLALKLMLSSAGNGPWTDPIAIKNFNLVEPSQVIQNAFLVEDFFIDDNEGVVVGDTVTITGATEGANNVVSAPIINISPATAGTIFVLGGVSFVDETDSGATFQITSQFNTLPVNPNTAARAGGQLKPRQVDVPQFITEKTIIGTLPTMDFRLEDAINLKEFISGELFLPIGGYRIDRKARMSIGFTRPPLALSSIPTFSEENCEQVSKITLNRQITKNFYNKIEYKFEEDLEGEFRSREIILSENSFQRINTGIKSLTIESRGLRENPQTRLFLNNQAQRFADTYQFAPESAKFNTNFKTFGAEVSDGCLMEGLQLPDIKTGQRDLRPRLGTIVNKTTNFVKGTVEHATLLSNVGVDGRFGVISPNSFIAPGSLINQIRLKPSFQVLTVLEERAKWTDFINQKIRIRSQDFIFDETVTLVSFSPGRIDALNINPPLSQVPDEDWLVDLPDYDGDELDSSFLKMKELHCFLTPTVTVTASIDDQNFQVSIADAPKLFVDAYIRVNSTDYVSDSTPDSNTTDEIVTNVNLVNGTITVGQSLGFTPQPGDIVDGIGFSNNAPLNLDAGLPYRLL